MSICKVKFYCDQGKITKIVLADSKHGIQWEVASDNLALKKKIDAWMEDYCAQRPTKVQLPLDMDNMPEFTKKILLALQNIPFGKTSTYQKLAIQTKNPKASRAVGNACGRNPFPLVIPCHRVLRSDGGIGGFAFGSRLKEKILSFELSEKK
jgi:O-6-methylguanine DNA methyltransferase